MHTEQEAYYLGASTSQASVDDPHCELKSRPRTRPKIAHWRDGKCEMNIGNVDPLLWLPQKFKVSITSSLVSDKMTNW